MKIRHTSIRAHGFTLLQMVIVVAIIAMLAALVIAGGSGAPRSAKRRATEASLSAIQSALDRYFSLHGEYPEPANAEEAAVFLPGKSGRIGAARCLYQALTGDGTDAIVGAEEPATASDGVVDASELRHVVFNDMPSAMRGKVGGSHLLIDGFRWPFQYVKADVEKKKTLNTTYDLWSFGGDDKSLAATSKQTEADPALGAAWIRNW